MDNLFIFFARNRAKGKYMIYDNRFLRRLIILSLN